MKLNNKTNTFILAIASAFLLSACGGGGSSTPPTDTDPVINTVKLCNNDTYSALKKGDKVTALTNDTEVKLRHNQDGKREACVLRGKAKIN